ncbi:MAG TPA: hypothetical protein PLF01_00630 [Alphaproteobacteria bacterium]|nr:hypothetical protein [Alphaproteobacteria bacterium]
MSITFQQKANHKTEQNSAGSLLLGAIFGGLTSEMGQAIDMVSDAAEIASEFHTYRYEKSHNGQFALGQKNSIGGAFANKALGKIEDKADIQNRYLNLDYTYAPRRAAGLRMAA